MAACLVWLAGCASMPSPFGDSAPTADANAPLAAEASAAEAPTPGADAPAETATGSVPDPLGGEPKDDLSLGKKHYRASNYGLAEQYFRKAVEANSKNAEAWVGLAAANDQLRRFDLADRAYKEAILILGSTPEILNNQGYSYMLRGDFRRARATLRKAQAADPRNPYILNNINLLEQAARKGRG
jgi:Flp pilus assembly protein TadD